MPNPDMSRDDFEHIAAKFIARVALCVNEQLKSSVFSSPLSARIPDSCMLWHPVYRNKNKSRLFVRLLISVFVGCLGGGVRLVRDFKSSLGYVISGRLNNTLLVITSRSAYHGKNGEFKTAYVSTGQEDGIFVFGPVSFLGAKAIGIPHVVFKRKLLLTIDLLRCGICAFGGIKGGLFDKILLLLEWLSWVCGLGWLYFYYLDYALSQILAKYEIKKVGCIHEMHAYSRTVWIVAHRYRAAGYTVQHASIAAGKRWYFPCPEEINSGLILPDVMYVYNNTVRDILKPSYENTRFILGCSGRYSHWKNLGENRNKGKEFLFVSGLCEFDNKAVILAINHTLSSSAKKLPIRLRLHPAAELRPWMKGWIRNKTKNHEIELSADRSLQEDLDCASVVIGMGSTVLAEALLFDRPVIQISHPDYLQALDLDGSEGVIERSYNDVSVNDLVRIAYREFKLSRIGIRNTLGLDHAAVTYKHLFAPNLRFEAGAGSLSRR